MKEIDYEVKTRLMRQFYCLE